MSLDNREAEGALRVGADPVSNILSGSVWDQDLNSGATLMSLGLGTFQRETSLKSGLRANPWNLSSLLRQDCRFKGQPGVYSKALSQETPRAPWGCGPFPPSSFSYRMIISSALV